MSGGWIMRARLARLLVMEPDLLLLDEPTNHLDLLSLLWLQNYLKNYSGAVLLISHDRQFMDEIVTQVHEISERKLIAYTGNYTEFLRNARNATNSNWPPTKTSRRKSPTCRSSPTGSAPFPRRHRRRKASSSRSSGWN